MLAVPEIRWNHKMFLYLHTPIMPFLISLEENAMRKMLDLCAEPRLEVS